MAKRKTYEQFVKDVYNRLGDDYKILDDTYPGGHGKVRMLHYKCGNKFLKNVHDIISKGSGCPYCNGTKPALYKESWVINNTPLPYHYISGYKGMKEKCLFHCDNCNTDFEQLPSRLINQHIYGCNCSPTKHWTHERFLEELGSDCLAEYDVLEEYANANTKINFRHKPCGTVFKLEPDKFITRNHKKYCPICYLNKSKGEAIIEEYLLAHDIDYQKEFRFSDLKQYRFDFYLPELAIVIEFDGIQHYQPVEKFGGQDGFNLLHQHDIEKNQYCLSNQLTLFRIPYTQIDSIHKILHEILVEKSSTTIEKFLIKNEVEQ